MIAIRPFIPMLLIVALSRLAIAQSPPAAPPTIAVIGVGEVKEDPDIAVLTVQLWSTSASLDQAQTENEQHLADIVQIIKEHGGQPNDLRPTEVNISSPNLDQASHANWHYIRDFHLTIRDITKLEPIVAALAKKEVDEIIGIKYDTTRKAELQRIARERAVTAAHEKATHFAQLLNVRLGKPMAISDQSFVNVSMGSISGYPATSREGDGQIHLTEQVEVVFQLLDANQTSER
jgi:uncharacterized protein YggE